MEEFISRLNNEQLNYLKEIKEDFQEMETDELDEWLTNCFQEQGLENIEDNPKQLLLESIIDALGEL